MKSTTGAPDRIDIVARYSRGEPINDIAAIHKISNSYVTRIARLGGAKLRKPHRWCAGKQK
jgi:DNA-directed RNA polymerase specialized sigma subunit